MQDTTLIIAIMATIEALLLLIAVMFFTSIILRSYNEWKFRKLEHLRKLFDKKLRESLESEDTPRIQKELMALPKSDEWQAIEDILLNLINEERYRDDVAKLFSTLGYVSFNEKQIENRNVQARALAINKLGRMKSEASVPKLIALLLDEENPEIVSIAVRSLSKIGGKAALHAIVEWLPVLLEWSVVTHKVMGMALQAFGAKAIPYLVELTPERDNIRVISCILEVLSRLPADTRSILFAAEHLSNTDAEVRSKALKVLGRAANVRAVQNLLALVLPLLQDPVWFVRLHAIRTIRALGGIAATVHIGKLIFDQNWQVRNEAAQALILLGERSLNIFLYVFKSFDRYAKESMCEEIVKTNLFGQLIENLKSSDQHLQKKSRQILEYMHSLGFSCIPSGVQHRLMNSWRSRNERTRLTYDEDERSSA